MQSKKKILTVVAFVLSILLLVGGIASAMSLSKREQSTDSEQLDIVKGKIKPKKLSDGGWSITSKDFTLELYAMEGEYGAQIRNLQGGVVEEQVNAINIQIKKQNAEDDYLGMRTETEMIVANYDEIEVEDNTIVATAEVESKAGSVFGVTDQYTGNENGGFELVRDIKVKTAAAEDEGFNSIVKFKEKEAGTYEDYEYFIPGTLFRDSNHLLPSAIGSDLSQEYVWVRESNMGLPLVMARNKNNGFAFSMGRIIEEDIYTGVDESQGSWIVNKNLEYGSNGISNVDGYVSVDICYPGMEGNINYLDGSIDFLRRSHPVREDVEHNYRVLLQPIQEESLMDATVIAYKTQFAKNQVPNVEADLDEVYDVTLNLFSDFTQEYAYGKVGMPFALYLEGDVAELDSLIGFVGQQTSVGFHLIRNGISTGSDEEREKGEGIIDTWVRDSFTEYGFPRIWFYTAGYEWAKPSFITCYLRYMTDGMEGILDAYLEEKADGVEKETWMARCREYADWLIKAQNEDGSYYRAYNPDTGEVSQGEDGKIGNDKNNTSCAVRYLVRMYEQTKEEKYLDAAIRAGEYVYAHSYLEDTYYGGTPDQLNMIDREAAIMALYAFNSLYQITSEEKWLNAAEHAAICSASYVYTFDFNVWGKETYNIYRDTVGTSGISRISAGYSGVDAFAAYLYYEYFKLYIMTGDSFYYNMAKLLQNNTKQFICIDESLPYGRDGIVNEAHAISNMFYATDVKSCLTWCNIAMIDPIASMEDAFGVKTIEEAKELGPDALAARLQQYGAGGNYR